MLQIKDQKMKNNLTTTQKTEVVLAKSKSLMGITKKLLESKSKRLTKAKASQELASHDGITIIGDLMWEKESREMNWDNGMEYAKNLRLGGYDDWRMPTIEELEEVVTLCGGILTEYDEVFMIERTYNNEANEAYQANYKEKGFASGNFWSSTSYAGSFSDAWSVYFYDGDPFYDVKIVSYYVRCVRAGQ